MARAEIRRIAHYQSHALNDITLITMTMSVKILLGALVSYSSTLSEQKPQYLPNALTGNSYMI